MSIQKQVHQYILERPSLQYALKKGFLNYSKVARQIIQDVPLPKRNFDAVLVALRRLERELKKSQVFERQIRELLKQTRLEIKNKMLIVIVHKTQFYSMIESFEKDIKKHQGTLNIVEGVQAVTIITNQEFESMILKYFKPGIIRKTRDVVEVILRSPESLEEVPGVTGYLYSLFADRGINIIETMSCWTDTIFLISENDTASVIELLHF
jgi:hypothetical protein